MCVTNSEVAASKPEALQQPSKAKDNMKLSTKLEQAGMTCEAWLLPRRTLILVVDVATLEVRSKK